MESLNIEYVGKNCVATVKYRVKYISALSLLLDLLNVELQLLSFQNVAVSSAALSWSRANASEKSLGCELILKLGLQASVGLSEL